jgi:RHS repeat-associated protein
MTSSPRETELCRYHYDPLDRLISHALADTPGRQRFYCKSRLTTEVQGAMRYSIVQQDDQLLAQQRSEGDAPETTLLVTDQQRSVLQTVKANHLPQPIAYSPYGHRSAESGLLSLLGFNGERPDPVIGCYLLGNGYRAFNPVLMRFISSDSLSPFAKGGLNSYAYCSADPINRSDPTGHAYKVISALTQQYKITRFEKTMITVRNYDAATGRTTTFTRPLEVPTLQELALHALNPRSARQLANDLSVPQQFSDPALHRKLRVSDIISERMSEFDPKKTYQKNDLIVKTYEQGLRGELPGITAQQTTIELILDTTKRPFLRSAFHRIFFEAKHFKMDLSTVIRTSK